MSGVPGKSLRCRRNRYPIPCNIDLTSISGFVLEPLIRDISQLLRSGLSLSTAVPPQSQDLREVATMIPAAPGWGRRLKWTTFSDRLLGALALYSRT